MAGRNANITKFRAGCAVVRCTESVRWPLGHGPTPCSARAWCSRCVVRHHLHRRNCATSTLRRRPATPSSVLYTVRQACLQQPSVCPRRLLHCSSPTGLPLGATINKHAAQPAVITRTPNFLPPHALSHTRRVNPPPGLPPGAMMDSMRPTPRWSPALSSRRAALAARHSTWERKGSGGCGVGDECGGSISPLTRMCVQNKTSRARGAARSHNR